MKKNFIPIFIIAVFSVSISNAQVLMHIGSGYGRRYQRPQPKNRFQQADLPKFEPSVNFSIGYGFPNLDKDELTDFYNYYKGNITQTGPLTGALDYQFSRNMSIGVMVTHGKVSVPYYDYNDPATPVLRGALDNWAFMVNIIRYMPVSSSKISPYIRTAIGVNTWNRITRIRQELKLILPEHNLLILLTRWELAPGLIYQKKQVCLLKQAMENIFFTEEHFLNSDDPFMMFIPGC